jgi:peroxiredoxin
MNKVIMVVLAAIIHFSVLSQGSSYDIRINLKGYADSIAYLGNYYGDKLALRDTCVATDGIIEFSGPEALPEGMYFLAGMKRNKLFEFLVGSDQHFYIEASISLLPEDIRFTGSEENERFYAYLDYNRRSYERIKELRSMLSALPQGDDSSMLIRTQMDMVNMEAIEYKLNIIDAYPNSVLALLFNVMREPEVPDFFTADGRHDSLAAYLYYKDHYWEYVDLGDDRFLRTPVFHRKLERYMDDVLSRHPDTLINEIDNMIAQTKEGSEMRNYLLWHFTNTYETSRVMSYDRIFVHMVDTYFTGHEYDWLHPTVQKNMENRAAQMRNVLIGSYAPSLIMGDTAMQFKSLHDIQADYIVVFFWSSTCGECKKEVDDLNDYYTTTDINLKIFAVNTDTTFSKWKDFITRKKLDWVNVNGNMSLSGDYHRLYDIYSTPVIYLLDRQKAIIAKRIAAKQVPEVISRHYKRND